MPIGLHDTAPISTSILLVYTGGPTYFNLHCVVVLIDQVCPSHPSSRYHIRIKCMETEIQYMESPPPCHGYILDKVSGVVYTLGCGTLSQKACPGKAGKTF